MVERSTNAPDVGYIDPYDVLGEDGWLGMDSNQMFAALHRKGYVHAVTFDDEQKLGLSLRQRAALLVGALRERGLDMGSWTITSGPNSLWVYSYLFKNSTDAVKARLILE